MPVKRLLLIKRDNTVFIIEDKVEEKLWQVKMRGIDDNKEQKEGK